MEISRLLFEQILEMFIMLLMGFLLVKKRILKVSDSKILSVILLYLAIPCAILSAFQAEFDKGLIKGLLLALCSAVLCHIILLAGSKILGKTMRLTAVEKVSVVYSNSSNLIIPIVTAILGEEWVVYSTAYQAVQLLLLWTHGKTLLSGQKKLDWQAINKIVWNGNLLAVFVGIIMFMTGVRIPGLLSDTAKSVGGMVAPASMFIVGMLVAGMNWKQLFCNCRAYQVVILRMIGFPTAVLLLFRFLKIILEGGRTETVLLISFLAAITPPATAVIQMSQVYGRDSEYAGVLNVLSTFLCIITMPVFTLLYLA